jgi:hypothetical protein
MSLREAESINQAVASHSRSQALPGMSSFQEELESRTGQVGCEQNLTAGGDAIMQSLQESLETAQDLRAKAEAQRAAQVAAEADAKSEADRQAQIANDYAEAERLHRKEVEAAAEQAARAKAEKERQHIAAEDKAIAISLKEKLEAAKALKAEALKAVEAAREQSEAGAAAELPAAENLSSAATASAATASVGTTSADAEAPNLLSVLPGVIDELLTYQASGERDQGVHDLDPFVARKWEELYPLFRNELELEKPANLIDAAEAARVIIQSYVEHHQPKLNEDNNGEIRNDFTDGLSLIDRHLKNHPSAALRKRLSELLVVTAAYVNAFQDKATCHKAFWIQMPSDSQKEKVTPPVSFHQVFADTVTAETLNAYAQTLSETTDCCQGLINRLFTSLCRLAQVDWKASETFSEPTSESEENQPMPPK